RWPWRGSSWRSPPRRGSRSAAGGSRSRCSSTRAARERRIARACRPPKTPRTGCRGISTSCVSGAARPTTSIPPSSCPRARFEHTNLRLTSIDTPPPRTSRPPSRVELDTALLGTGSLRVRGRADLGATPGPLGDLAFDLQGIELARFDQLTRPRGLTVAGGTLSASGQLTRDPTQTRLVIRQLGVAKPVVEYVQVTPSDEQRVEQATKETTEARERPTVRVDLDRAEITGGTFGFTDKKATYPYRLFLADTDVTLAGFSNERSQRD